jgi:argininosuccinate lyase
LKQIEAETARNFHRCGRSFKSELEDVRMCMESALTERIGESGRKAALHGFNLGAEPE